MQLQSCTRMKLFVLILALISCANHCCGERAFIPNCGKPPVTQYDEYVAIAIASCMILMRLSIACPTIPPWGYMWGTQGDLTQF